MVHDDHSDEGSEDGEVSNLQPLPSKAWTLSGDKKQRAYLGVAFFLFGLINNILYVVILSAALDLVPPATPKGIIAFCNIAPAFAAKLGWPYLLKGRVRYFRRVIGCCVCSVLGMLVVAFGGSLGMRLLGISLASFSSGLGELTFLQLSTTYPIHMAGFAVGYFASGTGGAGVGGAGLWWEVRSLGVQRGIAISGILPFVIPLTYFFLLPKPSTFSGSLGSNAAYVVVPTADPLETPGEEEEPELTPPKPIRIKISPLSVEDKWRLVRPLILKYMLPLFCVYTLEYTINQGIAPTLAFDVSENTSQHRLLSWLIKSPRDFYPFWQLVYQTFVFFSRSSLSVGIPPLPTRLLPLPAFVQLAALILLASESIWGMLPEDGGGLGWTVLVIFFMIAVVGMCGGSAYVNTFYHVGREGRTEHEVNESEEDEERRKQEREFQIGSIGVGDSLGIMLASLIAMPTEIGLCKAQVARGKALCRTL